MFASGSGLTIPANMNVVFTMKTLWFRRKTSGFLGLYVLPPDIPLRIWRILQIREKYFWCFSIYRENVFKNAVSLTKGVLAKVGMLTVVNWLLLMSLLPIINISVLGDLAHHFWFTHCNLFMANYRSTWCHNY